MNGCFGGFGVNPKRPRIKPYQDYIEEANKFTENNKRLSHKENAWLVTDDQINEVYNKRYQKEKNVLKEKMNMDLLSKAEYKVAKEMARKSVIMKCTEHKKYIKTIHNRKRVDIKDTINDLEKKVNIFFTT